MMLLYAVVLPSLQQRELDLCLVGGGVGTVDQLLVLYFCGNNKD